MLETIYSEAKSGGTTQQERMNAAKERGGEGDQRHRAHDARRRRSVVASEQAIKDAEHTAELAALRAQIAESDYATTEELRVQREIGVLHEREIQRLRKVNLDAETERYNDLSLVKTALADVRKRKAIGATLEGATTTTLSRIQRAMAKLSPPERDRVERLPEPGASNSNSNSKSNSNSNSKGTDGRVFAFAGKEIDEGKDEDASWEMWQRRVQTQGYGGRKKTGQTDTSANATAAATIAPATPSATRNGSVVPTAQNAADGRVRIAQSSEAELVSRVAAINIEMQAREVIDRSRALRTDDAELRAMLQDARDALLSV